VKRLNKSLREFQADGRPPAPQLEAVSLPSSLARQAFCSILDGNTIVLSIGE